MNQQHETAPGVENKPNPAMRFIRFIFRALRNYFAVIGFLVTLLMMLLMSTLVNGIKSKAPLDVPDGTSLELVLNGKVAEREPGFESAIFRKFMGGDRAVYLPELRAALKRAATDSRIAGVNVRFGHLQAAPADYTELRRLLTDFRAAGKRIEVQLDEVDDWTYYVASTADRLVLTPAGSASLNGPSFHLVYFGDALKKLGVDIDVVRAGKFKSAFEPFVENAPTSATLEEYRSMQTALLDHIVKAVAEGRKKDPTEVATWYKRSLFTGADALKLGIVDELAYDLTAEPKDEKDIITVEAYGSSDEGPKQSSVDDEGGIALIEAAGEITMAKGSGLSSDDGITPDAMREEIRWAANEKDVKAVVLRISSPGGSAVASDIIWNDLKELAGKKPLVVSMGAYAASGGYYISAPAKKIIAEPTTITGSIGVIGMLPSVGGFKEKYGVSFYVVTGSDRAALLNMGQRPSVEDRALVDQTIADVYETFIRKVAEGRGLAVADVEALAQGRVYTGVEAKALKLVDELGGLQDAFDAAKEYAGFDKTKLYPVMRYQGKKLSLKQCLMSAENAMRCLNDADTSLSTRRALEGVAEPERVAARLAYWVEDRRQGGSLALWPAYLSVRW